MAKNIQIEHALKAGATIDTKLVVPRLASDPGSPTKGQLWINSTDNKLKYYNGTTTLVIADTSQSSLDTEGVQDIVGALLASSATITPTYNDAGNTLTLAVTDSPTVGGKTPAQLQSDITAAIVNGSPTALDTLNELATALGNDANFATTITNSIATKAKGAEGTLSGGAASEVITHNLGTRAVVVRVYLNSGTYEEEEYGIQHTTTNTCTIVSEAGNIPTGRSWVAIAKGA